MLALEAAMIGVFVSLDLFLFYVFWDAMLIPMYFLIGIWGYERRIYAAIKFILYTMAGSVLMLIAILWIAYYHQSVTGVPSFDLADLHRAEHPGGAADLAVPRVRASRSRSRCRCFRSTPGCRTRTSRRRPPGSVILAGVLLKMGTYGLLRFAFPLFPEAAREFAPYLAMLAVDRHRLRRAGRDGAAGHEEARGVLVGEPPRLRRARHLRAERQRRAGRGLPDARARHLDRRPLPHRRHAVGPPAHAADCRVRRPEGGRCRSWSRRSC